eukprot:s2193_g1.t1
MPSLNGNGSQWMRDVRLICQEIPPPPPAPVEAKPAASKPRPRPKVPPKALQEQLQKLPGWAHLRPAEPEKAPPPPPTSVQDETQGLAVKVKPPPKGLNVEEAMRSSVGSKAVPVGPRSRSPVPRPPVKTPPARPAAASESTTSVPVPMAPASVPNPPPVRYSTTTVPVPYNLVGQGSALEQALADETATFLCSTANRSPRAMDAMKEIPPPPPPVEAKPTASKPRPRPKVAPQALQEQLQKMPGWAHLRPAEPLKAPPPPPTSVQDETPGLSVKVKPPPKGLNVEEAMRASVGSKAVPVGPRSRSPVPRPPVKTPPARPAAASESTTSVPVPMAPASVPNPPPVRYSTTAVPVPYGLVGQGSALEQALADETATF